MFVTQNGKTCNTCYLSMLTHKGLTNPLNLLLCIISKQ